jgi:DNA mismatch repair protein MutS2
MDSLRDRHQKTAADLGWPSLLAELQRHCQTDRGIALAQAVEPLEDLAEAEERTLAVSEARGLLDAGSGLPLGGVHDVREACAHAAKGGLLEPEPLLAIASSLRAAARLRQHILGDQAEALPHLARRAERISVLEHVYRPLEDSFEQGGRLRDDASPALGPLRRRLNLLRDELSRSLRSMLDDPELVPVLQDRFHTEREGRYVLPVRADARMRLGGIVHGASQSGATYYVEPPALVEANNRLTLARMEVEQEERRILMALSALVGEFGPTIEVILDVLAELDLLAAAARLSAKLEASPARLRGVNRTVLLGARHPLLCLTKGVSGVVPNDLEIPRGGVLIISGPNAGGKTVSMKTLGLTVLMARSGLHVCAHGPSIDEVHDQARASGETVDPALLGAVPVVPYTTVLSDVGDDQSLERDLSTFSAHLSHLAAFLAAAGPDTVVLLDELAVGTDPEQGAALAQSVLESFAARGATVVVTTHYERLKALAAGLPGTAADAAPRFFNASVGFALERLEPTYRLHVGVPGPSYAFEIARRLGLPDGVVTRATELSRSGGTDLERLLVQLSEAHRQLELERGQAARAQAEAEAARREADRRSRDLKERERKLVREGASDALQELRQARGELAELLRRVRRVQSSPAGAAAAEAAASLQAEQAALAQLEQRIGTQAPPVETGRPARAEELRPGAVVLVPHLGGTAVVESPPERGRVTVRRGALRSQVKLEDIRLGAGNGKDASGGGKPGAGRTAASASSRPAPTPASLAPGTLSPGAMISASGAVPGQGSGPSVPPRMPYNTCDLRGMRVDEAIACAERFADDALRDGQPAVFLLHGHGTGALRSAIRSWCAGSPMIHSSRPGEQNEGGDGVTVALLS